MIDKSIYRYSIGAKVAAASDVLKAALLDGGLVGTDDPDFVAHRMLEAAREITERFFLTGRLISGEPIRIEWMDKGDLLPGYDKRQNRFEAYTTWMRFLWPPGAVKPAHWAQRRSDRRELSPEYLEDYSQTDWVAAEASGDAEQFRLLTDLGTLARLMVDIATIEIEYAKAKVGA